MGHSGASSRDAARVLPYGSWPSAISLEMVGQASRALSEVWLDGEDLYFLEGRPDEQGRTVLMHRTPDGTVRDVVPEGIDVRTRAHEYGGGAFTVRGGMVVVSHFGDGRLYVQDTPTSSPEPLTEAGPLRYADLVIDAGRDRVIAVVEDHAADDAEPVNSICAISLTDGRRSVLAAGHDFCSDPRLDPSGDRLAWLTWDRPNMPWDGTQLWVARIRPDGLLEPPSLVAGGADESVLQPAWAPDGSLVYASDRTGWWNLYRWRPGSGSGQGEPIAPMEAECAGPQWVFGLSCFAVDEEGAILFVARSGGRDRLLRLRDAADPAVVDVDATDLAYLRAGQGVCAFVARSPTAAPAVVRLDLRAGSVERVREAASLAVDPGWISVPRHVAFPTSGGRTAYAFFYPPRNPWVSGPGRERPPLIVISHGGPTSNTDAGLSLGVQAWTSRGLAVVDVDYGGSTGYGRAYRDRLRGTWGITDIEDCAAAARWLAEQGLVDARRMAIRGASAGGYTTLGALCRMDVFSAGVSYFGVGDLEALARDTHKFESRYLDGLVAPWPEGREVYVERSPIHHVDRIRCPVLVLQGSDDRVVPPAQAEAIVGALARNGIAHAYLLFEGEGHGFRRAESMARARAAELSFYAQVFGFELADDIEPLDVSGLDARRGDGATAAGR